MAPECCPKNRKNTAPEKGKTTLLEVKNA